MTSCWSQKNGDRCAERSTNTTNRLGQRIFTEPGSAPSSSNLDAFLTIAATSSLNARLRTASTLSICGQSQDQFEIGEPTGSCHSPSSSLNPSGFARPASTAIDPCRPLPPPVSFRTSICIVQDESLLMSSPSDATPSRNRLSAPPSGTPARTGARLSNPQSSAVSSSKLPCGTPRQARARNRSAYPTTERPRRLIRPGVLSAPHLDHVVQGRVSE